MSESFGWMQFRVRFKLRKAILLLSILYPLFTFCQQSNQVESQYEWFDSLIGVTNSGIFEGEAYYDVYNVRNDRHQFFESSRFQIGSATYNGQTYFNLTLKYDIFNDNVIVKNKEVYWVPPMTFDSNLLPKFSIGGNEFVNFKKSISDGDSGFFEIILKSNTYSLLKKHKKKLFIKTENEILYHEFKDDYNYYLQKGAAFFKLKTAKELNSIYPEHKKLIKELAIRYKRIKKSDFDGYLKSILADLEKELSTTNKMLK